MKTVSGASAAETAGSFTVMCIDDNELLIDALERRLEIETGFAAFYRVDDFRRAAEAAQERKPSVVLLDIDLPGGVDAMAILDELVARTPESRVVILTAFPGGALVSRAMSAGAWGFVSKGVASDRLIDAIRLVVRGEAVIELED